MAKLQNTNQSTRSYSTIEEDVYEARISRFVFIGYQPQRAYQGKPKPDACVAKVAFELIGETVTMTEDGEDPKTMPAVVYWDIVVPGGGTGRGKCFDLLEATGLATECLGDTQDYKDLIGMPLNVEVGSYQNKKTGATVNCVNAVSKMNKKAKDRLEDLTVDTLFFDCYEDDQASREGWTQLGNFVRGKVRDASDSEHCPAVTQEWPDTIEKTEDGTAAKDEF